jgi:hypothetical protein
MFISLSSGSEDIVLSSAAWLALAIVGKEIRTRLSASAVDFEREFADSWTSGGFGLAARPAKVTHWIRIASISSMSMEARIALSFVRSSFNDEY